jgi:hypothetical protein
MADEPHKPNDSEKTETVTGPVKKKGDIPLQFRGKTAYNNPIGPASGQRKPMRKARKDALAIFDIVDSVLRETDLVKSVPEAARDQITHYLTLFKLCQVAYRNNKLKVDVECPHCGEKHEVKVTDSQAQANSIKALGMIYDRLAPKLGQLTVDIKAQSEIAAATEAITGVILKYVPDEHRQECVNDIQLKLAEVREKFYGAQR